VAYLIDRTTLSTHTSGFESRLIILPAELIHTE